MSFCLWIEGQKQNCESPLGADFLQTVQAIQSVSKGFQDFKKTPKTKIISSLDLFLNLIQELEETPSITNHEKSIFLHKSQKILASPSHLNLPAGPSLIYGSRSSPLLRLIPVLHALSQNCTVLFLSSPSMTDKYLFLFNKLIECGIPSSAISLLSTKDPESLNTLVSHPALKVIHFQGHTFEGEFLKKITLPLFQKKIKIHLGSKNPVIFTYDADLSLLNEMLIEAFRTDYLSEHRFHRWFVQEKNYSTFMQKIEELIPQVVESTKNKLPRDADYLDALKIQNTSLFKEKNWKSFSLQHHFLNPDFSNCSPWHQQETLGPLLTITRFKNSSEVIKFANTTLYACSSVVFSSSIEKSKEISSQLIMPHHFLNCVPDIGSIDAALGLPECGFGNEILDERFFSY